MQPVVTASAMLAFEAAVMKRGMPSLLLMDNAGRGGAEVVMTALLSDGMATVSRVLVLCGPGNNGGDGYAFARHLRALWVGAASLTIECAAVDIPKTTDAHTQCGAWRAVGGVVINLGAFTARSDATTEDLQPAWIAALSLTHNTLVIDALFGTGLRRPIEGHYAAVIAHVYTAQSRVIALDMPSGLDTETGQPLGACMRAEQTLTFGFRKLGLCTPQGQFYAGCTRVVSLGVPANLDDIGVAAELWEHADVAARMALRSCAGHKYTAGHVAVIGGAMGMRGAAILAATSALRAGAGAVTMAVPGNEWPQLDGLPEVMTRRLGTIDVREALAALLARKRALVVGPGLGLGETAREIVDELIGCYAGPWVADADALTLVAAEPKRLRVTNAVLTPHAAELARLLGCDASEVDADRFAAVREACMLTGCVVLLKGTFSIVGSPTRDLPLRINSVGSSVLATAGSGDVLAGIIGALLCSMPPFDAAIAGAHLHGAAGAHASTARNGTDRGVLASDLAAALPAVLGHLQCLDNR